ncbi:hypothetical protein GCM10010872_33650 [Dyella flava]|nr:hypothetical protein GCM10010872_33650 [Dyella flava]
MCHSSQIWVDFKKCEQLGGAPNIRDHVQKFWERKKSGDWTKHVPKAMRDAFNHTRRRTAQRQVRTWEAMPLMRTSTYKPY